MSEYSTVFGIDSHARTTTVCAIVVETGETATRTLRGSRHTPRPPRGCRPSPGRAWAGARRAAHGPVRGGLHRLHAGAHALRRRHARGADSHPLHAHEPRGQGEEDRPDGRRQARQGGAGRPALRGLGPGPRGRGAARACHLLEDLSRARAAARLRVDSLLLRHGVVWDERTARGALRKQWGAEHWAWLRSVR